MMVESSLWHMRSPCGCKHQHHGSTCRKACILCQAQQISMARSVFGMHYEHMMSCCGQQEHVQLRRPEQRTRSRSQDSRSWVDRSFRLDHTIHDLGALATGNGPHREGHPGNQLLGSLYWINMRTPSLSESQGCPAVPGCATEAHVWQDRMETGCSVEERFLFNISQKL